MSYEPCGIPGWNLITHCVEPKGHEGFHTYGPAPEPETKLSDTLEEVRRLLVSSCPDWVVGDLITPRPKCCPFHHAAWVVGETQTTLRAYRQ